MGGLSATPRGLGLRLLEERGEAVDVPFDGDLLVLLLDTAAFPFFLSS